MAGQMFGLKRPLNSIVRAIIPNAKVHCRGVAQSPLNHEFVGFLRDQGRNGFRIPSSRLLADLHITFVGDMLESPLENDATPSKVEGVCFTCLAESPEVVRNSILSNLEDSETIPSLEIWPFETVHTSLFSYEKNSTD